MQKSAKFIIIKGVVTMLVVALAGFILFNGIGRHPYTYDELESVFIEKAAEYKELQSSPMAAARRGYVDTIIEPADTRKYLIGAFEMLFTKREERPSKKHGTV